MHVQDGVYTVFFTGVDDLCQASEAAFIPVVAGLFIKQGVGVQHDTHAVEAQVRHQLDVFFTKMVFFPAVPVGGRIFRAAELGDHLGHEAAGGPALRIVVVARAGEQDPLKQVLGQGGGTDHEAFGILPVCRAVTV